MSSRHPASISPDGQWLLFNEAGGQSPGSNSWIIGLEGVRTPRLVAEGMRNARISPDGRWLAYESIASGQVEVYATPFPGPGPRIPVSASGGDNPLWSPDGRELFYTRGDTMMAVTLTPGATLAVGAPRTLYDGRYRPRRTA